MTRDEMHVVATHEAGHAVTACVRGLPLAYTALRSGGPCPGLIKLARPFGEFEPSDLLLVVLAGGAAEAKVTRRPPILDLDDAPRARVLAEMIARSDADVPLVLERYRARSRALVEIRWLWIQAVAAALTRDGNVTGTQVYDLQFQQRRHHV